MAWNKTTNKSLFGNQSEKTVGPGAPVANNPGFTTRGYKDSWDIERAYREGMQRVTWVSRCVDAIAGNQARLPMILRKGNSNHGEIIVGSKADDSTLLEVLNTKSNIGENSFIFRYRLSSQLLISTRGVFIEKVRSRNGDIIGLNLLPPQSTSPIPDPKTFVSGYEVMLPHGPKIIMKPEDVVWVRKPHPLDPYLSMTPMEAAGVAIEIENMAKLYNRNFLMNDGRPGGLLVLRGEIDDEDKEELRSRFRGNLSRSGSTSVVSSDDGVDFVDTASNPRDAAYIQMRQITKEEILASFGVPESVIGNAAGRTFSNAAEEHRVFWNETMLPHLEPIARALDELDDKNYVDFDLSEVPILILYKQERERYVMDEFQNGLISANEYRKATGKKTVESDLADSMLQNPNLTPIGNTEKPMPSPEAQVPGAGVPGMPGAMPPPGAEQAGGMMTPDGQPANPLDPTTMAGALAATQGDAAPVSPETAAAPVPAGQASLYESEIQYKSDHVQIVEIDRWTEILNRALERVFDRQQRVVLEKATGAKSKKQLSTGSLDVESILSPETWARQMDEDIRPVLSAIILDAAKSGGVGSRKIKSLPQEEILVQLDSQMERIKKINEETSAEIKQAVRDSIHIQNEDDRSTAFRAYTVSAFTNLLAKKRFEIAESETVRAWRFGSALKK
ncbi:MAG TPA: phage portal protein [Betaproteobacteria bacterium]|nr:phage portal protein [Betaproteobacteria bacterium]